MIHTVYALAGQGDCSWIILPLSEKMGDVVRFQSSTNFNTDHSRNLCFLRISKCPFALPWGTLRF